MKLIIFIIYMAFVKAMNNPGKLGDEDAEPMYHKHSVYQIALRLMDAFPGLSLDISLSQSEWIEGFIRAFIYLCVILSVSTILSQVLFYILHFIFLRYSTLYQSWVLDKTARWRIAWTLVWSNDLPAIVQKEKDILASGSRGWMYNFFPWSILNKIKKMKRGRDAISELIAEEFVGSQYYQVLSTLLDIFPHLIFITEDGELCYWRKELISAIQMSPPFPNSFLITSFERSLKHMGLRVTQSTHNHQQPKKWVAKERKPIPKPHLLNVDMHKPVRLKMKSSCFELFEVDFSLWGDFEELDGSKLYCHMLVEIETGRLLYEKFEKNASGFRAYIAPPVSLPPNQSFLTFSPNSDELPCYHPFFIPFSQADRIYKVSKENPPLEVGKLVEVAMRLNPRCPWGWWKAEIVSLPANEEEETLVVKFISRRFPEPQIVLLKHLRGVR